MDESLERPHEVHEATTPGRTSALLLSGRVAFVTGGAQGLGAAICRNLAAAGAIVVAGDVLEAKVHAMTESLAKDGWRAEGLRVDVGDKDSIGGAFKEIVRRHGRCDVLVNNAGTDLTVSIEDMPVEQWQRILDINLTGPFMAAKAVLPYMRKQGGGNIVNIVSTAAKRAWPNASAYHASKWGLLGLSHAMHVEARPLGIKVTAVISGGLRTPFLLDRFPEIDVSTLQDPAIVAETVRFVLLQPAETVIPEIMVIPMRETSWP